MTEPKPIRFIGEEIEPHFGKAPILEKKPGCPQGFIWRGELFRITGTISEWHDYDRRGRMAANMRPEHARTARRRGSWGVGQDYFRVRTEGGRIFDLYYDRAPQNVDKRKGSWHLHQELSSE